MPFPFSNPHYPFPSSAATRGFSPKDPYKSYDSRYDRNLWNRDTRQTQSAKPAELLHYPLNPQLHGLRDINSPPVASGGYAGRNQPAQTGGYMPQNRPMQSGGHMSQNQPVQAGGYTPNTSASLFQAQPQRQSAPPSPQTAAEQFRRVNKSLPDGVMYEPLDDEIMQILKDSGKLPQGMSPTSASALPPTWESPISGGSGRKAESPGEAGTRPAGSDAFFGGGNTRGTDPPRAASLSDSDTFFNGGNAPDAASPNGTRAGQTDTAPFPEPSSSNPHPNAVALAHLAQDERNAQIYYRHLAESAPREDFKAVIHNMSELCRERTNMHSSLSARLYGRDFSPEDAEINTQISFEEGVAWAMAEETKAMRTLSELLVQLDDAEAVRTLQNMINRKMVDYNMLNFIRSDGASKFKL